MFVVQRNQQAAMQQQQEQDQRFQANLAMQMCEQQMNMMQQSQQNQMMFQAQVLGQLAQSLGLGVGAQQPLDPVQSMPMYGGWPMPMNGGSNIPIHTTPDGMAHRQRRDTFNSGGGGISGGSGSGGKNASYSSNSQELEDFIRII
jgi:hypothetical protein